MAFIPLLVGGVIGLIASKMGNKDEPAPAVAAAQQPGAPKATDLPPTPTPAPQAQSAAVKQATQVQAVARRRAAGGSVAQVQPRRVSATTAATAAAPALAKPVMTLGGGI